MKQPKTPKPVRSSERVRPLCEIKTVDDGRYIRLWRFTAGWFTRGNKKGIIALYRSRKAYYFRVWDACLAYYKPSDEWIWKEWHWPKNVEV